MQCWLHLHGMDCAIDTGEELSFNQTVGLRTSEAGYQAAEEPAYGQNVSGIGGGVCQVATALYRLALLGGMDISERNAAVYPVDYCDIGQEAAVSDQGLDLKIVDSTDRPMFLTARVYAENDGQTMELQLIGLELDESSYACQRNGNHRSAGGADLCSRQRRTLCGVQR